MLEKPGPASMARSRPGAQLPGTHVSLALHGTLRLARNRILQGILGWFALKKLEAHLPAGLRGKGHEKQRLV